MKNVNDSEMTYGTSQAYLTEGSQCKHSFNSNLQFVKFFACPVWFDAGLTGHVRFILKVRYAGFSQKLLVRCYILVQRNVQLYIVMSLLIK